MIASRNTPVPQAGSMIVTRSSARPVRKAALLAEEPIDVGDDVVGDWLGREEDAAALAVVLGVVVEESVVGVSDRMRVGTVVGTGY